MITDDNKILLSFVILLMLPPGTVLILIFWTFCSGLKPVLSINIAGEL